LGRIRIGLVKRVSRSLLKRYPNLFTPDYEKNKRILDQVLKVDSKKLKDQIAGYVTHLVKLQGQGSESKA